MASTDEKHQIMTSDNVNNEITKEEKAQNGSSHVNQNEPSSDDSKTDQGHDSIDSGSPIAFDVDLVIRSLEKCVEDKNAIDIDAYLDAYRELLKFFYLLGSVFGFVAKDVDQKIKILEEYRSDPDIQTHYATIQSMIEYETEANLLRDNKRPSGARTLLRLHRALEFVAHFMLECAALEAHAGTSHTARDCYNKTLAKHHPWYIRKSASLAMMALPSKVNLIERAFGGSLPMSDCGLTSGCRRRQSSCSSHGSKGSASAHPMGSTDSLDTEQLLSIASEKMTTLANRAESVFHACEKYYDERKLLDLP